MQEAIERAPDAEEKIAYTFTVAQNIVKNKGFRTEILMLLIKIYETKQGGSESKRFDYYKICKCQFFLNMPDSAANLLVKLVCSDDTYLVGY